MAVVLDSYSRLVIGWALERTLEAKLAVGALRMALDKRGTPAGLIHHSDRGVQYACGEYTQLLTDRGIQISMSRKGNPYDNAPGFRVLLFLVWCVTNNATYVNAPSLS